jgi:SPP1 family predicted phage head-tail adaptor
VSAGKYRHLIRLQVPGETEGPLGPQPGGWVDWEPEPGQGVDIPAEVVPLSGRDFIAAGEKQSEVSARIEIRYLPGVVDTMRVLFDEQIYAIAAVLPDPTARRHLTLMVSAGVTDGR